MTVKAVMEANTITSRYIYNRRFEGNHNADAARDIPAC